MTSEAQNVTASMDLMVGNLEAHLRRAMAEVGGLWAAASSFLGGGAASNAAAKKNLELDGARITNLKTTGYAAVLAGTRTFSNWSVEAKVVFDDINANLGWADEWKFGTVLGSTAAETGKQVKAAAESTLNAAPYLAAYVLIALVLLAVIRVGRPV